MVKDDIVNYRMHEAILILRCLKRIFSILQFQYLTYLDSVRPLHAIGDNMHTNIIGDQRAKN